MNHAKYLIRLVSFFLLVRIISSCDLERELITFHSKETVNRQYELFHSSSISLYGNLPIPFDGQIYFDSPVSDESNDVWIGESEVLNNGSWNQYSGAGQEMESLYNSIRRINDFLHPIVEVDLDPWKLSPLESDQLKYETYKEEIKNAYREARFLRAFFYFELVKRYGGVPIITEPLTVTTNFASIDRNTLEYCFQFIINELDDITQLGNSLPLEYPSLEFGRATKGAALALKSRVLLYMASDLYHSVNVWAPDYSSPEYVSLQGKDRNKLWKQAADAAKAVIDLGIYVPTNNYNIIGKNFNDKEFIFVRRAMDVSNHFEWENCPRGYLTSRGRINPSQNLVDAYENQDGTKFNWTTDGDEPYFNRDPRLAMTIYCNESPFKNTYLEIFEGGLHGKGASDHTTQTGYYLKKFIDEAIDMQQDRKSYHTWCFFRISEIYLNYAEALNEYDPGNPDILIFANKSRDRDNVKMPYITETDQSLVRERIRSERRVELAFEGHRFYDLRRWMTAEIELNKPLRGVNIQYENYDYHYTLIDVEQRKFLPKMYFHPIQQNLLLTEGVNWPQNPLW